MRLFVGIDATQSIKEWVAAAAAALSKEAGRFRWIPPENAHWTIAFLGEQPEDRLDALKAAMKEAAASSGPFRVAFGALGAFDSWKRARVLWIGVAEGAEALGGLAEGLKASLKARGFAVEERPFKPHLTLAKSREPVHAEALRDAALPPAPSMAVDALTLFRSHVAAKGSRYETLFTALLHPSPTKWERAGGG